MGYVFAFRGLDLWQNLTKVDQKTTDVDAKRLAVSEAIAKLS
jgi:hypothetical protein